MNKVLFSHNSDEWTTPQKFFDELNAEFSFTVDAAATIENKKCKRFYVDGLACSWTGETVFCNPPYSNISEWVKKACSENALTVLLVPARTDTKWFHNYIYGKHEIRFIKGRLKFGDGKKSAPFPSMLVIVRRK